MPSIGDLTRIRTNVSALNALNALKRINDQLNVTNLRLATGKRINSAADDPAGLTLAGGLDLRARRIGAAINNIGDAQNLLSIAESGLSSINDILATMMEKLTLAANDTQGANERAAIFEELNQLGSEIDALTQQTQYNGRVLLTAGALTFQAGPDGTDVAVFGLSQAFTSAALGINQLTVASQALASLSMGSVQAAIGSVQAALQRLGATMERMQIRSNNLSVAQLNVTAASSRIMDADLAAEQLNAAKLQILQQTATAQLAAANAAPASLLTLFR
ncbi:MAG TPA: flagellin [Candidatus Binatia bacterium]|nr:flagellin [Candidatus Binatia bacterium]